MLGVVAGRGTTHGYAVHAELVSWGADDWAKVKWGSIYHALRQLAKDGLLAEVPGEGGRTDYRITAAGRDALRDLVRGALSDAGAHADLLAAGLAFLATVPRAEAVGLLRRRLAGLRAREEAMAALVAHPGDWPQPGTEHVPELFGLWHTSAADAARWTAGLVERIEAGAYTFADELPPG